MRFRVPIAVVLIACLVVVPVAGAAWAPAVDGQPVDADTVVIQADLAESGAAVWTVEHRVRLDTDNETTAFEELQADVGANESRYAAAFRDRMNGTVGAAEDRTGRSMSIANVSVDARIDSVPRSTGVLTYRFRWAGFAASGGDRLTAGDALAGLYLDDSTVLTMAWPDGYRPSDVRPDGERGDRSVTWYGPRDFGPDEPRVVVAPDDGTPATDGESTFPLWPVGLLVAVAFVAVVAFWGRTGPMAEREDDGSGSDRGSESETRREESHESSTGPASDDGDGPVDSSLLRNDEQVRHLLEANDGRMKQQAIAAELEWTDAKTSQVIGDLREDGVVETFRIGRENVVELTSDESST